MSFNLDKDIIKYNTDKKLIENIERIGYMGDK